jgi:hypothetical protein
MYLKYYVFSILKFFAGVLSSVRVNNWFSNCLIEFYFRSYNFFGYQQGNTRHHVAQIADMKKHVNNLLHYEQQSDEFSSLVTMAMTLPSGDFETTNFYADPTVVYGMGPQAVPVPPEGVYKKKVKIQISYLIHY